MPHRASSYPKQGRASTTHTTQHIRTQLISLVFLRTARITIYERTRYFIVQEHVSSLFKNKTQFACSPVPERVAHVSRVKNCGRDSSGSQTSSCLHGNYTHEHPHHFSSRINPLIRSFRLSRTLSVATSQNAVQSKLTTDRAATDIGHETSCSAHDNL